MVQSQLHTRRSISRLGAAISSSSMFPISCVHLNFSQPSMCSAEFPASREASTQRPASFSFPISKASRVHDSFLPAVTLASSKSQHLETNIRPSVAIPTASVFSACESPVKLPSARVPGSASQRPRAIRQDPAFTAQIQPFPASCEASYKSHPSIRVHPTPSKGSATGYPEIPASVITIHPASSFFHESASSEILASVISSQQVPTSSQQATFVRNHPRSIPAICEAFFHDPVRRIIPNLPRPTPAIVPCVSSSSHDSAFGYLATGSGIHRKGIYEASARLGEAFFPFEKNREAPCHSKEKKERKGNRGCPVSENKKKKKRRKRNRGVSFMLMAG